ncbi:MAG TPA: zeta toxin family protein [Methylocella sp.]|nr:zeta toxin family protein [Methylocella sp.]
MTVKSDKNAKVSPAAATDPKPEASTPKLILPVGRGARGKTFLARWLIDRAQMQGREIVVADADRTNPSLGGYLDGVLTPPSADENDMREWFKAICEQQMAERFSLLIDLGGGDLLLKQLARRINLVPFLKGNGVDVVAIHLIGPERDDLAYLRDLETDGLVAPEATILVLNESLAPQNLSIKAAFEPVFEHPIFKGTLNRGARLVWMPRLDVAHEINARRLPFTAAESGARTEALPPLGPWNRQLITMWLRAMEHNFASVASWLP